MWSNMLYFLPLAAILSTHEIEEEETLQGPLQDELIKLFEKTIHHNKLRIVKNEKLNATINTTYPSHSNLWTIMDGVIQRYHLVLDIQTDKTGECVTIQMMEGPSWKK